MQRNTIQNRIKGIVLSGLTLISGSLYQSCGGFDTGYGYYDYGGYGPIDSGVFDNANQNFSDYLRGSYEGGEWDPAVWG